MRTKDERSLGRLRTEQNVKVSLAVHLDDPRGELVSGELLGEKKTENIHKMEEY